MSNDDLNDGQNDGTDIPGLREAAERGKQKDAKIGQLERENAFLKAGINPSAPDAHKGLPYFMEAYKGDLTAEAITKAAADAGFINLQMPTQGQQQQIAAEQQVAAASTGAEKQYDASGVVAGLEEAMSQAGGGDAGEKAMIAYGLQNGLLVAPPR